MILLPLRAACLLAAVSVLASLYGCAQREDARAAARVAGSVAVAAVEPALSELQLSLDQRAARARDRQEGVYVQPGNASMAQGTVACVGGRVARREANGWSETGVGKCRTMR